MAPTEELFTRQYCRYGFNSDGTCAGRSGWYYWGRWIVAGIAIFIGLLVLACCLCVSRRRRKAGVQPMYGTGWLGGGHHNTTSTSNKYNNNGGHEMNNYPPQGYNQGGYDQQAGGYNQQQQYGYGGYSSPPPYGQPVNPQMTGSQFNSNDGYYGQQYGVQQPPHTYQPDTHYSPPAAAPPPAK